MAVNLVIPVVIAGLEFYSGKTQVTPGYPKPSIIVRATRGCYYYYVIFIFQFYVLYRYRVEKPLNAQG